MAAKTIVMLVGPSGNNLKTTLVEVAKKAWFEKFADVSVGVLNSSNDSASSTQANLAYFAGNKNILIIDEVGYQGSTTDPDNHKAAADGRRRTRPSDDTTAVWKQIDSAMTKAKLKICSKECDDIMSARSNNKKKRKRAQHNSSSDDDDAAAMTNSGWLMDRTVHVKAFANKVSWWNCMSGTVSHTFNDVRTCYNMLTGDRYPFSVSDSHSSPWLAETDAIARHCASSSSSSSSRRLLPSCEIKDALHCLVGDYASKTTDSDVASIYGSIIVSTTNSGGNNAPGDKISDWKLQLKGMTNLSSKAEKVFNDLVKGDAALLRWTTMDSVKHADRRPALMCLPDSKPFKKLFLDENTNRSVKRALGKHRLDPDPYEFSTTNNNCASDGVLYAFHAVHSGAYDEEGSPSSLFITDTNCSTSDGDAEALGPVLNSISYSAIANHRAKSRKLSSIIFGGDDDGEVDEDSYVNMEREYDRALFNIMEKPSSKSFPKITTDGALVMSTSSDDCRSILNHIKKTIVDTGKFSNTGSFIGLCAENGLSDDKTAEEQQQQQPAPTDHLSSVFGLPLKKTFLSESNNNTLRPRCRKMLTSLIKFKSDGRTVAVSDIASVVSSKSDAGSAITTEHMLPGQFNSNTLKKITSKQASAAMRGIFCKPVVSSISMTPIMTSNSYVFTFFVDEALAKRMIIFPCNTQFAFGSVNENVETFVDLVDSGLKCVHSALTLERQEKWKRDGTAPPRIEAEKNMAMADNRISTWNESVRRGMRAEEKYVSDLSSVAATLPARALQLLVKNSVLEHRDVTSMAKLEESANTFMHMYTTFTLASKSERSELLNFSEATDGGNEGKKRTVKKKTNSKPLQMCQVNPKSLNTLSMVIANFRREAWTRVNAAMNCVFFVETPFVHTSRLFGEDCNLKMFCPKKEGVNPNINLDWCIGLRLPNPDMDVNGYRKEGPMIGAGTAVMKQVCDAWGSMDIKNIMYSCHHLHMLFELVFQHTQPKRKLSSVDIIRQKNKAGVDYVAVVFAMLIYKEMMSKLKYPVFVDQSANKKNRPPSASGGGAPPPPPPPPPSLFPFEIPMFVSMVINKPLAALRSTTNFEISSAVQHHTDFITYITGQLGQILNVNYLCPACKKCI